ncbi:MAG: hypothetical protein ABSC94_23845 [Polyangiaceae bacterium]
MADLVSLAPSERRSDEALERSDDELGEGDGKATEWKALRIPKPDSVGKRSSAG